MKLMVKIGLITLLFFFKYQSADAEILSSAIERCTSAIEQSQQEHFTSDHINFDEETSFSNGLMSANQQVLVKLTPDDLRFRRAEKLQQDFLKILIGHFSLREDNLAVDKAKIFPSNPIHCVSPACHYFVFRLRRILI